MELSPVPSSFAGLAPLDSLPFAPLVWFSASMRPSACWDCRTFF